MNPSFYAMSDTETASVPQVSLETNNAGDSAQPSAPALDTSLSNTETLWLFSQLLDVKFDQKFAAFKRNLKDKEAITQSQLKKLKTESKASNSFTFKGNKVQYNLNISLHNLVDGAIKNISKGNLSPAISELESVKTLRALAKICQKKHKTSPAHPRYTSTHQPSSEVSSAGPSNTFPVNHQLFRGRSFHERRRKPSDKCFGCGQRGHWANSTSCPTRRRGTIAFPSSSKAAN